MVGCHGHVYQGTPCPGKLRTRSACQALANTGSVRDLSRAMRGAAAGVAPDSDLAVLMSSLRGSNMNQDDFAAAGTRVSLLEAAADGDTTGLPLAYDPAAIADYWAVRPVSVVSRILQLGLISGSFLLSVAWDAATGQLQANEVSRAIQIRNIVTSLGPAYIKLGQALSIRPDLLSPAAMRELQKLCDKVPSFDNAVAMAVVEAELGMPWHEAFAELTESPIAAASLGQVYRGRLHTGEEVAVKVQRPGVLETVTIDLFIIRAIGEWLRGFPSIPTDFVALLDEWATRFFEELDYVKEGENATLFAAQMRADLPQIVVAKTYERYTARRVLTVEWLDGEKLSQSKASDVGALVNLGVICYLKQLLETGFFHADPHPGNLIRTPDGRLAILDFGLMTTIDENISFGLIEAISHLIHRDYEAIVNDFVTLQFIPKGTDLRPILPVLANVFDQALEGGGAKNINFQELAADLANITFEYPFRIPPYFALIIRAISVLEGIALVGDEEFAIIDEAFPFIANRLMTSVDSPRLQESLRYMIYGRSTTLQADRIIDLFDAFETFMVNSTSASGDIVVTGNPAQQREALEAARGSTTGAAPPEPEFALPWPFTPLPAPQLTGMLGAAGAAAPSGASERMSPGARAALQFVLSPRGQTFRAVLLDEVVKSIDALSRNQLQLLLERLGLSRAVVPVLLPGSQVRQLPLSPHVSKDDLKQVDAVATLLNFLAGGSVRALWTPASAMEIAPLLPQVAVEILPEVSSRLLSRVSARIMRQLYLP